MRTLLGSNLVFVISYNIGETSETQIEQRLGVEALAAVIMNFDSDCIEEYESIIAALGWTIADIIWIPPGIFSHKIQLMPDHKPSIEHQRRLNPPMQEVVKKEIIKWLDAGVIYPIADSSWVCPIQCVPKKGGMTLVPNEKNELVPMRSVTGWRVCMYYRKLNSWTEKDHFPIPFMDQMFDRLAGKRVVLFS